MKGTALEETKSLSIENLHESGVLAEIFDDVCRKMHPRLAKPKLPGPDENPLDEKAVKIYSIFNMFCDPPEDTESMMIVCQKGRKDDDAGTMWRGLDYYYDLKWALSEVMTERTGIKHFIR